MRFLPPILLALVALVAWACTTTRYQNPKDYPAAQLTFGNGGGFSGMVTEYVLLDNGQLLKKLSNLDSFEIVKNIDKNQTKQIFTNYDFLNIGNIKHTQPGNVYSFIRYKHEDKEHEIIWGNNQYPPEQNNLKIFHQTLIGLAKNK